jgi:hypothetical protein
MASEYEELALIPWKQEVAKVSKIEMKEIASGVEVDVIRANMQALIKKLEETEASNQKRFDSFKISSENAFKMNEDILNKIQEINERTERIKEDTERKRPEVNVRETDIAAQEVEEDTEDEPNGSNSREDTESQTEYEPENDMSEDIIRLKILMADILNEEIKNTIPRL